MEQRCHYTRYLQWNYLLQSVSWRIFHLLQYVDLCSRSFRETTAERFWNGDGGWWPLQHRPQSEARGQHHCRHSQLRPILDRPRLLRKEWRRFAEVPAHRWNLSRHCQPGPELSGSIENERNKHRHSERWRNRRPLDYRWRYR